MTIELNNGKLRLQVVPDIGGSIIDFSVHHTNQWIPIMRKGESPLTKSSNASSFVLIPYSNRIRDSRFSFQGKEYQLREADKHAIHGNVRDRALKVEAHSDNMIVMSFHSTEIPDINFPFPFSTSLKYSLEDSTLWSQIDITNTGQTSMPAGCGFHPYFNRRISGSTSEVELQVTVSGVYPGETPLPTGPAVPISSEQNFHTQRTLNVALDHCFAGWNREAILEWPGSGIRAHFHADPGLEHIIVYSPAGKEFFAVEPVTNANDGFNLYDKGDKNCGVVVLGPHETLQAKFGLNIHTKHSSQDSIHTP